MGRVSRGRAASGQTRELLDGGAGIVKQVYHLTKPLSGSVSLERLNKGLESPCDKPALLKRGNIDSLDDIVVVTV